MPTHSDNARAASVNDFWICDYGRFRSEQLNEQDFTVKIKNLFGF